MRCEACQVIRIRVRHSPEETGELIARGVAGEINDFVLPVTGVLCHTLLLARLINPTSRVLLAAMIADENGVYQYRTRQMCTTQRLATSRCKPIEA